MSIFSNEIAPSNYAFHESMLDILKNAAFVRYPIRDKWFSKPPKFRRSREVHAARARKLRRRGEYVHFVRWEHGHCIYSWSGPTPETFTQ